MMENTAPMGESPATEETTDAAQVDYPAAQASWRTRRRSR